MDTITKILILEHDIHDIDLINYELKKSGINFQSKVVHNEEEFRVALKSFDPAIILSDYSLPAFDGPAAFKIKNEASPGIPFIIVSGTVGEERAVELIKSGVTDYVLKDKLFTLMPKIIRALKEEEEKKEKIILDKKLHKANNLNAFISQVNQNIVRVKDEATLFRNSCQLAIEFGKFKMSWVGLFDFEKKTISLIEQCGIAIVDLVLFADAPYQVAGPQDYVLRTDEYFLCNDIQKDLELISWKPFALKRGINSCMVLPIKRSGKTIGTFNLYSSELNFSGTEEIKLLLEVADDISFALDLFEKEKKQTATDELVIKNEKRFRALIEKSVDMKTLSDREGNFTYGSPSITKILGYTSEEVLKMNIFGVIHPDDSKEFLEKRKELLETFNIPFAMQMRFKHKNGIWIWCEGTITNMLNDPAVAALVSNFGNISEKKETEKKRVFEENNLNALINNTSDLMWSVDRDFNLITSNEPFNKITRLSGRVIPKGANILSGAFSQEQSIWFKSCCERAFAGETFTELEHRTVPGESWLEISFCPIRKGDEVIGCACYSRDITEKKKSEEQLIKSEFRLNEAQAIAHLGNWEVNFSTGKVLWSEEACKIYGLSPNENIQNQLTWNSFIHPEDLDYVRDTTLEAEKTFNDVILNHRIIRKDGTIKHVYSKGKFKFHEGNTVGIYGIVLDVTERKLADEEREKMIASIVQHSKNLEQFASIVSHNLRAPVANILGLANVLNASISQTDRIKAQDYLFTATRSLDEIVTDLNKILQVRSEINEYKEVVYFEELVSSIKSSIHTIIEKETVQIITDFQAIDQIVSIKSYIYSIFYNLISNGIKYRKEGTPSVITIKTELLKGKINILFRDDGIGIDLTKYGDKVFGLYKRFHLNVEGKGLGLFMIKTQIETLGGTIKIKSKPCEGTEFVIQLPL